MKSKYLFSALFLFLFTLAACGKKSVTCSDCPSEVTLEQSEFCESDFGDKDEYDQAVAVVQAFGCDCK